MPPRDRIAAAFAPFAGKPAWGVHHGYSSSLTFEFGEPRLSAWIVRSDHQDHDEPDHREPVRVDLGPIVPIEQAVRGHLRFIASDGRVRGVSVGESLETADVSLESAELREGLAPLLPSPPARQVRYHGRAHCASG